MACSSFPTSLPPPPSRWPPATFSFATLSLVTLPQPQHWENPFSSSSPFSFQRPSPFNALLLFNAQPNNIIAEAATVIILNSQAVCPGGERLKMDVADETVGEINEYQSQFEEIKRSNPA